jgi:hypothetical protein
VSSGTVARGRKEKAAVKGRMMVVALSAVLALAVAMPVAFGQAGQGSTGHGQTGELAAAWWRWAGSKPVPKNPLLGEYSGGPKCNGRPVSDTPGEADWWFLAGTIDGSEVERACTVPAGRRLFFPVANIAFLITEPGEDEGDARAFVNGFVDGVLTDPDLSVSVTVDGKEVLRRADSPLFTASLPEDNVFGLEAGEYEGVADGLWAKAPPLAKGKHTVRFELSAPTRDFEQDNTYRLTVKGAKDAS